LHACILFVRGKLGHVLLELRPSVNAGEADAPGRMGIEGIAKRLYRSGAADFHGTPVPGPPFQRSDPFHCTGKPSARASSGAGIQRRFWRVSGGVCDVPWAVMRPQAARPPAPPWGEVRESSGPACNTTALPMME